MNQNGNLTPVPLFVGSRPMSRLGDRGLREPPPWTPDPAINRLADPAHTSEQGHGIAAMRFASGHDPTVCETKTSAAARPGSPHSKQRSLAPYAPAYLNAGLQLLSTVHEPKRDRHSGPCSAPGATRPLQPPDPAIKSPRESLPSRTTARIAVINFVFAHDFRACETRRRPDSSPSLRKPNPPPPAAAARFTPQQAA